jgi:hypothetical protein
MQLAVDYLLQQIHNYSLIAMQQTEYAQATAAWLTQFHQKITDQDIQIQRLNSSVQQLKAQNQAWKDSSGKRNEKCNRRQAGKRSLSSLHQNSAF